MNKSQEPKSGLITHFLFSLLRFDVIIGIVVFLFILILYESMAPDKLSSANFGSDGGDFLTAVVIHGVPHPSGYPLYLILSDLVHKTFIHGQIWRQVQVSIIPAALAVLVTFWISGITILKDNRARRLLCMAAVGVAIGTAPIFWSQAVIIEVYALNALFVSLALLWLFLIFYYWQDDIQRNQIFICVLSWLCGLGLGNHTTYLFLYPLVGLGFIQLFKSKMKRTLIYLAMLGWFSGLFTYLLLPVRAALHPAINWGDASTFQGFIWLVTGGSYSGNLFSIFPDEYNTRILSMLGTFFRQFGLFGLIAGIIGLIYQKINRILKWSLVYIVFVYAFFSIGYRTNDSFLYIIPGLICFSIVIGWGIHHLWQYNIAWANWGIVLAIAFLINTAIALPARYKEVDPRSGDLSDFAESTLTNAPQNAVLYPTSDGETFSLWYAHFALGERPDVKIISRGLLKHSWYQDTIKRIYPDLDLEQ